jgi:guanine nucleotide-binding protein G(i) subunit alpha
METDFKWSLFSIRLSQVCGQRGEWRKWIHLFEGATSIMFYVPLSGYDQLVVGRDEQVCLLPLLTMHMANRP